MQTQNILSYQKITFKAKGLLLLILSYPEIFQDPKTNKEEYILANCKEGPDAIKSGIKELQKAEILVKQIHRNQNGGRNYIIGSTWEIPTMEI